MVGSLPAIYFSRYEAKMENERVKKSLEERTLHVMTQLDLGIDWQEVANVPWAGSTGLYFETKDGIQQAGLVPTSRIPIDTTRTGFHNAFPVENLPTMERWRRAMYRQRHLIDKHSNIDAVVLEIPRAPLV